MNNFELEDLIEHVSDENKNMSVMWFRLHTQVQDWTQTIKDPQSKQYAVNMFTHIIRSFFGKSTETCTISSGPYVLSIEKKTEQHHPCIRYEFLKESTSELVIESIPEYPEAVITKYELQILHETSMEGIQHFIKIIADAVFN